MPDHCLDHQELQPYVVGVPLEILTDHHNLQWLRTMKDKDALLTRWKVNLQDYQLTNLHHPRKQQGHTDSLSRLSQSLLVAMVVGTEEV